MLSLTVTVVMLLVAMRYLPGDEATRLQRALALGEPIGEPLGEPVGALISARSAGAAAAT